MQPVGLTLRRYGLSLPAFFRFQNLQPQNPMVTDNPTPNSPSATPTSNRAFSNTILSDFVARLVKLIAAILSPKLVTSLSRTAGTVGHWAMFVGSALTLVLTIIWSIRSNSFGVFLIGLALVVALAVAQFITTRFLGAADMLIANTPSRISTTAFLECVGFLFSLIALALLLSSIGAAIAASSIVPLIPGFVAAVLCAYMGAIALHPEIVAVEPGQGSAGEEAIGLISFFLKAGLKLVPPLFALFASVGVLVLIVSLVAPDSSLQDSLSHTLPSLPLGRIAPSGFAGAGIVLYAGLLPMFAYFGFLVALLPLELWRAILSIPGKLDSLRR